MAEVDEAVQRGAELITMIRPTLQRIDDLLARERLPANGSAVACLAIGALQLARDGFTTEQIGSLVRDLCAAGSAADALMGVAPSGKTPTGTRRS